MSILKSRSKLSLVLCLALSFSASSRAFADPTSTPTGQPTAAQTGQTSSFSPTKWWKGLSTPVKGVVGVATAAVTAGLGFLLYKQWPKINPFGNSPEQSQSGSWSNSTMILIVVFVLALVAAAMFMYFRRPDQEGEASGE